MFVLNVMLEPKIDLYIPPPRDRDCRVNDFTSWSLLPMYEKPRIKGINFKSN